MTPSYTKNKVDFMYRTLERLSLGVEYTGNAYQLFLVINNIYDNSIDFRDKRIRELEDKVRALEAPATTVVLLKA